MASRQRRTYDSSRDARDANSYSRDSYARSSQSRSTNAYSRAAYGDDGSHTPSSSYSRRSTQAEYSRIRAKKKRKKVIGTVFAVILGLALVGGGAAFAYMNMLNDKLTGDVEDVLPVLQDKSLSEPFYMLIMGTDTSEERQASELYEGDTGRSDSMILARIDPVQKQVTLVSIERDTLVEIKDGTTDYGENKINAAYALGGAALTVKTVSEFAGVPISHYAEINFDGFKSIVDALGGVEVNVPLEIDDEDAGGHVDAGWQTLDGDQALILCRSRHAYDEYGSGDYYRAANQRMVMGAIAKKLLDCDAVTMANTVTALCDYVTTDLSVTDIAALAISMRGMDTSTDIYSTMNPTTSAYVDGGWYEYSNAEAWTVMMQRIDQGLSPTPDVNDSANTGGLTDGVIGGEDVANAVLYGDENDTWAANLDSDVEIEVQNGSGIAGVATTASTALQGRGATVTGTGNADSFDYDTTLVVYSDDSQKETALNIASILGVGSVYKNDGTYDLDSGFLVILGTDYGAS